jgi:hypothetical protein
MSTTVRGVCGLLVAVLLGVMPPASARADDKQDPEQLKKAYDDALVQLKAAQERKNQLAADNEKLAGQLSDLQKQVDRMKEEMDKIKRADAEQADQTFFLRSHFHAWQNFIRRYPDLQGRWKAYFDNPLLSTPRPVPGSIDLDWPPGAGGGEDF